jgi:hypothetical protein
MKKQRGYINTDGLAFFFVVGLVAVVAAVVCTPFFAYFEYQEYKEEQRLIKDCERGLPRDQTCEIIKVAKARQGGAG